MNTQEVSYLGEVWKDIKDYEDEYEVSNLGRVRNKKTKKILKLKKNKGYFRIGLRKNGKRKFYFVHRLVYEAFIGEIPEGYEVNHKDENKENNVLSNIDTLMTRKENNNWGTRNERAKKSLTNHPKKSKPVIQKSLQGDVIKIWVSIHEIERELGFAHTNICFCCNGKYKQAYGYIWEYYTEKATA